MNCILKKKKRERERKLIRGMGGCVCVCVNLGLESAKAAVRGGLKPPPGGAAAGGLPPSPVRARRRRRRRPRDTRPAGTAALGCPGPPAASPCLSFSGLAGFARLCPGDQYEVRLGWFMVCLTAEESKGRQSPAAFYIAMKKAFSHQHPKKQLLFFLYML